MKKYLIALAVALMVCLVGMTASASEAENADFEAAIEESSALIKESHDRMDAIDPSGRIDAKTQMQIMGEVFEEAGWTVVCPSPSMARVANVGPKTMELAYTNIDESDSWTKEKILCAREEIISNTSWQNDIESPYALGYVTDYSTRELIFAPLFSEVFPGWDPPRPGSLGGVYVDDVDELEVEESVAARDVPGTFVYYDSSTYIPKAGGETAPNFVRVPVASGVRNTIEAFATSFNTSGLTSINIGFGNLPAGGGGTTFLRIGVYYGAHYDVPAADSYSVTKVGVRASTYTTAGYANMKVRRTI